MGHTSSHRINYCHWIGNFVIVIDMYRCLIHTSETMGKRKIEVIRMDHERRTNDEQSQSFQFQINHLNEINHHWKLLFFSSHAITITYMYNVFNAESPKKNSGEPKKKKKEKIFRTDFVGTYGWIQLNWNISWTAATMPHSIFYNSF